MKNFPLFIFSLFLVAFQLSSLDLFFGSQKSPNLVLAFVICLTILISFRNSLGWVVFIGLLLDAGTGWIWGTGAFLLVLAAWAVDGLNFFSDIKSLRRLVLYPALAAILFASAITYDWASKVFSGFENHLLTKQTASMPFLLDAGLFWSALFTAFLGVALFAFVKRINNPGRRKGLGTVKRIQ